MNISWLALDVNILDDSKIKLIRKMPGGSDLFILWIGLMCLAMKSENCGLVEISPGIPYSPDDLADLFSLPLKTVQFGLQLFSSSKFQMIQLVNGTTIEVCKFLKHQQIDKILKRREQTRERVQRFRNERKLLITEGGNALLTQKKRDTYTSTGTDTIQEEIIISDGKDQSMDPPGLSVLVYNAFKTFIEIYPKPEGVFQGSAECEAWFGAHQKGTVNWGDLVMAARRYRESEKVKSGCVLRPIKWLNEYRDWIPKATPAGPRDGSGQKKITGKWEKDAGLCFGPCTREGCKGQFYHWHFGSDTKVTCDACGEKYVAPPGAAEQSLKSARDGFSKIGKENK